MVDLMSVEGGPGGGASPAKLIAIFVGVLCALLAGAGIAVAMTLPKTVSCHAEEQGFYVEALERPTISNVSPLFVCLSQGERNVTFSGSNFMVYNGNTPVVDLGLGDGNVSSSALDDGTEMDVYRQEVTLHEEITAALSLAGDVADISTPTITVSQPVPEVSSAHFASAIPAFVDDACGSETDALVVVPPPQVRVVYPRVMCTGTSQPVIVDGQHFVVITDGSAAAPADDADADADADAAAPADDGRKRAAEQLTGTSGIDLTSTTSVPVSTSSVAATSTNANVTETSTSAAAATTTTATETTSAAATSAPADSAVDITVGDQMVGGAVPSVAVGDYAPSDVVGTTCAAAAAAAALSDCSQIGFTVDVDATGVAADALASLSVTNPEPIGCAIEEQQVLIVAPMTIAAMDPPLLVAELADATAELSGTGFLRVDGAVPRVRIAARASGAQLPLDDADVLVEAVDVALGECSETAMAGVETCTSLTFRVPAGNVYEDGAVEVFVTQAEPLAELCGASISSVLLPAPKITSAPSVACVGSSVETSARASGAPATVEFVGVFYDVGGVQHTLSLDGATHSSLGMTLTLDGDVGAQIETGASNAILVQRFSRMRATLPDAVLADDTELAPVLELAHASLSVPGAAPFADLLTLVPALRVELAPYPGLCTGVSAEQTLEFEGDWFVTLNGTDSVAVFTETTPADGSAAQIAQVAASKIELVASTCSALNATTSELAAGGAQRCGLLRVTLPPPPAGATVAVRIESPAPLQCAYRLPTPIKSVAKPVLTSIAEASFCVGGDAQTLSLTGQFPLSGGELPQVLLQAGTAMRETAFGGATCSSMSGDVCTQATLPIDAARAALFEEQLGYEQMPIAVRVAEQCESNTVTSVTGLPTGRVSEVVPSRVCVALNTPIMLTGESLLSGESAFIYAPRAADASAAPELTFANAAVGGSYAGCASRLGSTLCTSFNSSVTTATASIFTSGNFLDEVALDVGVRTGGNCESRAVGLLTLVPRPTITNVETPSAFAKRGGFDAAEVGQVCRDQTSELRVTGTHFAVNGGTVELVLEHSESGAEVVFAMGDAALSVTNTEITLAIEANSLPAGVYEIVVRNGAGCERRASEANAKFKLNVNPVITIHSAAPNALPLVNVDFTVFTSGLLRGGAVLTIVGAGVNNAAGNVSLAATPASGASPVLADVNALTFQGVHLFLKPGAAAFSFHVESDIGCVATSASELFHIVETPALAGAGVEPAVVVANTEFVVRAPAGTTFAPGTQLYVRRAGASGSAAFTVADVVEPEVLDGGAAVRGLMPEGGSSAMWDVLVVDQQARVGHLLAGAVSSTARQSKPDVDVVTPSAMVAGAAGDSTFEVRVLEGDFSVASCRVACRSSGGAASAIETCAATTNTDIVKTTDLRTTVVATFSTATVQLGSVCRIELTDAAGYVAKSPPLAAVGAPGDANSVYATASGALSVARYDACGVVTRAPPRKGADIASFVHVFGGSDASNNPLNSYETAPIVETSVALPPFRVRGNFTHPASGAACAVAAQAPGDTDATVLVIGGSISAGSTARVLQPADALTIAAVPLFVGASNSSLPAGTYSYVVAFVTSDMGESLPSTARTVLMPAAARSGVVVSWPAPRAGFSATQFLVYRATGSGAFALLATLDAASRQFVDDGSATPDATLAPRQPGDLGRFTARNSNSQGGLYMAAFAFFKPGDKRDSTAAALDNRIAITGGSITGAAPGRTVVKLFSPFTFAYSNGAAMPTALIKHTVLRTYDATNHQLIALVGGTTVNALSSYSSSAPTFTQSTVANGAPLGACGAVAGSQAFFLGGESSTSVHKATFTDANNDDVAEVGAVNTGASVGPLQAQQQMTCARADGKVILAGGGNGQNVASTTVQVVVV